VFVEDVLNNNCIHLRMARKGPKHAVILRDIITSIKILSCDCEYMSVRFLLKRILNDLGWRVRVILCGSSVCRMKCESEYLLLLFKRC
jgi:hypothetical protein